MDQQDPRDEQDGVGNDDAAEDRGGEVAGSAIPAGEAAVEDLRGLVVYLASNLIDESDTVEVAVERRGGSVHLSLRVPEGELGKVIGRQGRIARAMRTVVAVAASRHNLRASLDIEG